MNLKWNFMKSVGGGAVKQFVHVRGDQREGDLALGVAKTHVEFNDVWVAVFIDHQPDEQHPTIRVGLRTQMRMHRLDDALNDFGVHLG